MSAIKAKKTGIEKLEVNGRQVKMLSEDTIKKINAQLLNSYDYDIFYPEVSGDLRDWQKELMNTAV